MPKIPEQDPLKQEIRREFLKYNTGRTILISVDEFLCNPLEAIRFCERIRLSLGTDNSLSDKAILMRMMGMRKSGELNLSDVKDC